MAQPKSLTTGENSFVVCSCHCLARIAHWCVFVCMCVCVCVCVCVCLHESFHRLNLCINPLFYMKHGYILWDTFFEPVNRSVQNKVPSLLASDRTVYICVCLSSSSTSSSS